MISYFCGDDDGGMQYLDVSEYDGRSYVCGDIHGEFATLVYEITQQRITNAIVIVAGDCGFGFEHPTYYDGIYRSKMHKRLKAANVLLLMVRGNHDDPIFFEKELADYPYMKCLPDYTIVHTRRHNILCVGGAVSEDRQIRKSMMEISASGRPLWWEDEAFEYREEELRVLEEEGMRIDTVVTHTCSKALSPEMTKEDFEHFCANDDRLEEDVTKEWRDIEALYDWLKAHDHPLRNWYYGHYHRSLMAEHEGTIFHQLDIMELKEIPSV